MLLKLNYHIKERYVREIFNKFDKNKNGTLDFPEFVTLMDTIRTRNEL